MTVFSRTTKAVQCISVGSVDESHNVSRLPMHTLFHLVRVLRLSFRNGDNMKWHRR